MNDFIEVKGARAHNLKNITLKIPRDAFIVLTGPSGSGKSSLAFDTIYAEGQRRYVESLSVYAKQFLDQAEKPDVDEINGLSPTISIEQRTTSYNPRSTVGTVTEIYDYLRVLFSRVGKPFCYSCEKPIQSQSAQQISDHILTMKEGDRIGILSPIIRGRKGEYQKELLQFRQKGFVRAKIDGKIYELNEEIALEKNKKHDISIVIDRLIMKGDRGQLATRVNESVELALKLSEGLLIIEEYDSSGNLIKETLFSEHFACVDCGISYPSPEPRTFSFNSPLGACSKCEGIGFEDFEPDTVEDDQSPTDAPAYKTFLKRPCSECNGDRLKKESLHFKVFGKNISELCKTPIETLLAVFESPKLTHREHLIADKMIQETFDRLTFLNDVGAGYLDLARPTQTLSGGEAQRIRLASQIGSSLVGVIYVLDEPSIGLHARDTDRLLLSLEKLRDQGNTVIVVEHDRETMEKADFVVDMGPGAGSMGGTVVDLGSYDHILKSKKSMTGKYLSDELKIPTPKKRRKLSGVDFIKITGVTENNLKNISLSVPLGRFTCVTGVSGSGKSSLIVDTLYPALIRDLYGSKVGALKLKSVSGTNLIDKAIDIDQTAIGKTPRSNPSTYTGIFSHVRELFSSLPESKARGYAAGRFSFNVGGAKGGRCSACEGDGIKKIEMHFLPDVRVQCDLCLGKKYNFETLEIRYRGKNIADVLSMTVDEALLFFDAIPQIKQKLNTLNEVGLGYIQLGQSSTTLSGGESQRIKLARELSKRSTGKTFYILDEPSTGLHFDDIKKLTDILQRLVDQGNTVLVIEHNLDIIKLADHVIDLGPTGGSRGGYIVAEGTPEEVAKVSASETGRFLKGYLK